METFDYERQLIHYNGESFPFVIIDEKGTGVEHIISVVDLDKRLMNKVGDDYVSKEAQWIDEQITYFVETEKDLHRPAKEILAEIYD
jgi:hypothetical protein